MTKEALLRKVAESILSNERMAPERWCRIVVIASIEIESSGITALVYLDDGSHRSVAPRGDPEPMEQLARLRVRMAKDDNTPPWLACLILFDRRDEDVDMDFKFEYDDADRWTITPNNREDMVDRFQPNAEGKQ